MPFYHKGMIVYNSQSWFHTIYIAIQYKRQSRAHSATTTVLYHLIPSFLVMAPG